MLFDCLKCEKLQLIRHLIANTFLLFSSTIIRFIRQSNPPYNSVIYINKYRSRHIYNMRLRIYRNANIINTCESMKHALCNPIIFLVKTIYFVDIDFVVAVVIEAMLRLFHFVLWFIFIELSPSFSLTLHRLGMTIFVSLLCSSPLSLI